MGRRAVEGVSPIRERPSRGKSPEDVQRSDGSQSREAAGAIAPSAPIAEHAPCDGHRREEVRAAGGFAIRAPRASRIRRSQNSFRMSAEAETPWMPWETTGMPTSNRISELFHGPFNWPEMPAPE
jgi:hypothetical protein